MRRKDKELTDPDTIARVLDAAEWGTLGLVSPEGTAVLVPLNFVRLDGTLYFHSAHEGEKMDILRPGAPATFLVVDPLAAIPSYALDPDTACKATQFYISVILYGHVHPVEALSLKAQALEALMRKVQPEGGYRPITASDPRYTASLAGVAILAMTIDRMTAKQSVGQRLTPTQRAAVTEVLEQRGDQRTLQAMARPT